MTNARQRRKLFAGAGLISMLFGALMVVAPTGAGASNGTFPDSGVHKVTICHRTNSVTNPYVTPTVDFSAVDGSLQGGPNHMIHAGDPFDFSANPTTKYPTPRNGNQWGDIIPPVPYNVSWNDDGTWSGSWTTGRNWGLGGQPDGRDVYFGAAGPHPTYPPRSFYEQSQVPKCGPANTPPPPPVTTLKVVKVVDGLGEDAAWTFPFTGGLGAFDLTDDVPATDAEIVDAGVPYVLEETDAKGAAATAVSCPGGTVVPDQANPRKVTVTVSSGAAVVCTFTNTYRQGPTNSVTIVKTNDASGDGTYGKTEGTAPGSAVKFRLVITNTGDEALQVTSLDDAWTGNDLDLLAETAGLTCTAPGEGGNLSFDITTDLLQPDVPVTCDFTVANYVPGAGSSVTNTVTLDTDKTGPATDTSTVTTPPANGCVGSCGGGTPPTFSVSVDKVNDANDDGEFGNSETAPAAGADVEFQVTIRNTGTGNLKLASLVDAFGTENVDLLTEDLLACEGTELAVGSILAPGATIVCTFTLEDYAPAAGTSLVNTVTVGTDQADASDDSRVRTRRLQVLPEPPVENPPPVVTPPVDTPPQAAPNQVPRPQVKGVQVTRQLPRTGSESTDLAGFGAGLLLLGVGLTMVSRSRRYGIVD